MRFSVVWMTESVIAAQAWERRKHIGAPAPHLPNYWPHRTYAVLAQLFPGPCRTGGTSARHYSATLTALGPAAQGACAAPTSTNACLIDWAVSNATVATTPKSGYYFVNAMIGGQSYIAGGSPATFNQSGVRNFCSIADGVVRFNNSGSSALITTTAACVLLPNLN